MTFVAIGALRVIYISVLLLAYMNGNGNLCRAIVRAGAPLGIVNKQGLSIFNTPVASKQLLFKLLGKLLSCQPIVTVTSCFVYTVIRDLELIDHLFINHIRRIGLIHK